MKRSESFDPKSATDPFEQAASDFVRRRLADHLGEEETPDQTRSQEPNLAESHRLVEQSWAAIGRHSTAPEIMALRERAIARARRASARRWLVSGASEGRWRLAAAIGGIALLVTALLQRSHFDFGQDRYRTAYGEQRVIELPDHSRMVLDARTRLRVRYSDDVRSVQLLEGQAQFSVAKDPTRPFKVMAGGRAIVAVGTVFNVEYVDREVDVAMVEGRVEVLQQPSTVLVPPTTSSATSGDERAPIIELNAGEELRVHPDGRVTVSPKADIEAATAWRQGKVIFRNETLAEAARRLNRYSRRQLRVEDAALAQMTISGVFDSGDVQAFAEAMQSYLPVAVDYSSDGAIRLKAK